MPDLILLVKDDFAYETSEGVKVYNYEKLLQYMARMKLIKKIIVRGHVVYARHYLSNSSIREAFNKAAKKRRAHNEELTNKRGGPCEVCGSQETKVDGRDS